MTSAYGVISAFLTFYLNLERCENQTVAELNQKYKIALKKK